MPRPTVLMAACCLRRCCGKSASSPPGDDSSRHCYLAFALDEKGEKLASGWKRRMLQSAAPEKFNLRSKASATLLDKEWLGSLLRRFSAAIAMGTADLLKNAEKFADQDEPDYLLMSVTKARKMGTPPHRLQIRPRSLRRFRRTNKSSIGVSFAITIGASRSTSREFRLMKPSNGAYKTCEVRNEGGRS